MALKDYFYFTREERRGVVALLVVIAVLFGVRMFIVGEPNNSVIGEPVNRLIEEPLSVNSPIGRITDSPKYKPYTKRTEREVMLELNSADTLQLQELRGIGPGFARRIVKYREKLGGYYAKEQLMEIYGFTEELYGKVAPHITVDASKIRRLDVNAHGIAELKLHPYISFYEAKAIVEYRNTKPSKRIDSIDELANLPDLKENWEVIRIYIKVE
ncbi:MAG: helix-hairpin-helix domain-containing protein [Paludibacteraceae bacterium]|nr:helix-hairpin-helix domain-containing protein [Paludibacteraceae bacterium]